MPAITKKQQQFMGICSHSPGKARGKCPPHAIAQEFSHKPKSGYKKKRGGMPRKDKNGYY
jgi:hypothetical protein